MTNINIRPLNRRDRAVLIDVIDDYRIQNLYRRPGTYETYFTAHYGEDLVGFVEANLNSDFHGNNAWDKFNLPPRPHAYLIRIHVANHTRGQGIGTALIQRLALEAQDHGCTLLGAMLDTAGDVEARCRFFTNCGFTLAGRDHAVATPADIVETTLRRT